MIPTAVLLQQKFKSGKTLHRSKHVNEGNVAATLAMENADV